MWRSGRGKYLTAPLCVAEILPSRPERVFVESVSMTTLRVSWRPPLHSAGMLTGYVVNLTSLKTFDDRPLERAPGTTDRPDSQSIVMPHAVQIKVSGSAAPVYCKNNPSFGESLPKVSLKVYEI